MKNTSTKISYFLRSFASRKRVDILILLNENKNLSIKDLAKKLNSTPQNISLHTFKLLNAGLIAKQQHGSYVWHILTNRGKKILNFIKNIDQKL